MIIFITDEGRYWNHENPILERYADSVRVICLNGEAVTDKYKCIVSPYKPSSQEDEEDYSVLSLKYKALKSIENIISHECWLHGGIVFLADQEPRSLFPYMVLKDNKDCGEMHLWCMPPWKFESKQRRDTYYNELLHDIDKLTSILFVDPDDFLLSLESSKTSLAEATDKCREWFNSLLPDVLSEIESKLEWGEQYYYDLKLKRYISIDDPYSMALYVKSIDKEDVDDFFPFQDSVTLGLLMDFDLDNDDFKKKVERLHPRIDGKKVCDKLKQMRIQIAEANGIELETAECPSTGPCAGTCPQCDAELRYLQEELLNKKEKDREYPFIEIKTRRTKENELLKKPVMLMGVSIPMYKNVKIKETKEGETDE